MGNYYRYTTLTDVKAYFTEEQLLDANITNAKILSAIEQASTKINAWTKQVFYPCPEHVRVSSRVSKVLQHPDNFPFLDLNSIAQLEDRTTGEFREGDRVIPGLRDYSTRRKISGTSGVGFYDTLSMIGSNGTIAFDRGKRTISLIALLGNIASGFRNVDIKGWFGWLEDLKKIETKLLVAIPVNTSVTTITIESILNPNTNDFITIGDVVSITVAEKDGFPVIVESGIVTNIAANGPNYDITLDATHVYPLETPIDAKVFCYGKVPLVISQITAFLAAQTVAKLIDIALPDEGAINNILGNIISETTDNYSYKIADNFGAINNSNNSFGKYTGNPQMDLLLREFMQPSVLFRVI